MEVVTQLRAERDLYCFHPILLGWLVQEVEMGLVCSIQNCAIVIMQERT